MSVVLPVPATPRTATHALSRIAFGPRPGDARQLLSRGLATWISEQLYPAPDRAVEARLTGFPTLAYSIPHTFELGYLHIPQIHAELKSAKLIRAVHSQNQLQEVLVDFWFNHFNVNLENAFCYNATPAFERDAIRPHVLGPFRDLLHASANHVAMMFSLDNHLNRATRYVDGVLVEGINENYGRELMELHTVGVDAGYTQEDVFDAARCFTGWGIDNLDIGNFVYRPQSHDTGRKRVFGYSTGVGGQKDDGDGLLDHLATHPSTARFLSRKLAQRFVADDPPASLITRCAATFEATAGDIRAVLATMFSSPEFWAEASGPGKLKTPLELVTSTLRAVDADVAHADGVTPLIADMGMPLYLCNPPTGYSNRGIDWLDPSALLNRINFALDAAANRIEGVTVDADAVIRRMGGRPQEPLSIVEAVDAEVLAGRLAGGDRQVLARVTSGASPTAAEKTLGLCLASAAMQRR